ncbi:MAG: bacterial Ig-like domain-containing protein [Clostridia bacterium]|nr:bacterial Ig-like domain-containing protein [Clostridia bacterium]
MKNKKFLKAVAAITMSGLTAFGAMGLAACAHSHNFKWESDAAEHWKICDCGDEEPNTRANHDFVDGRCECGKVQTKEYEMVSTKADLEAALNAAGGAGVKPEKDLTVGRFTFGAGVYFEASSSGLTGACVNNQQKKISFELKGADNENSISFEAKGGSSAALKLYKEDGTVVKDFGTITAAQTGLKAENLPAGKYYLQSVGSGRLANIVITEKLEKSAATGITVSGATNKFLAGRAFNSNGLSVMLNYENGRQDSLTSDKYTLDSSKFNKDVAGTYEISVSYKENPEFKATYKVAVYAVESITAYDYVLDSSRVTKNAQKLFKVGEAFNSNNVAVQATCSTPNVAEKETFVLKPSEYTVTAPETTLTAGAKTVEIKETVSGSENKTDSYEINVLNLDAVEVNKMSVTVDAAATAGVNGNVVTVNTINDALRAFKLVEAGDNVIKNINVAAGDYKEKVEIDMPNVHITGANTDTDGTKSVVWFDKMNGLSDPSGTTTYSTDGSASVSIRAAAVGFKSENITFKNYWNTNALYEESKKITSGTQAVAVLVQADKCVFENVTFLGYHDTLYDMTGRHIYNNCHIEGRTDYIFGYNSTAYFNGCTIKTIGAGLTEKNGGYVVATKGCSKGEADSVEYGYIFNGCTFIDDGNVQAGTVSLARGWDKYMTLAFINSQMSGAYSKTAYGTKTDGKNDRYTNMNAAPVAAKLFEYGNTGDGAVDTATAGTIENLCTVIDAARAADFSNFAKIFAAVNGKLNYSDAWDGEVNITFGMKTYDFTTFTGTVQGDVTTHNGVTIDATNGKIRGNGNSSQINAGTILKMPVKGTVSIVWYSGNGSDADVTVTYEDGCGVITVNAGSNPYIVSVTVDLNNIPQ